MMRAIALVFPIRIEPWRIVSVARVELVVRRHSAEEMGFVVVQPAAAEKASVGVKRVVEVKPVVEVKADARSLQPTAAVTAPSVEFRTVALLGCKAITDSPVWGAPASVAEAAVDSVAVEVVSAAVDSAGAVHAVAVEAGDRHDHKNNHDRDLRAGGQSVGADARAREASGACPEDV
jgi:hypothetical protein